jgi:hypothetical protein
MIKLTLSRYKKLQTENEKKRLAINRAKGQKADLESKAAAALKKADELLGSPGDPERLVSEARAQQDLSVLYSRRAADMQPVIDSLPKEEGCLREFVETVQSESARIQKERTAELEARYKSWHWPDNPDRIIQIRVPGDDLTRHDHVIKFGGMASRGISNDFSMSDFLDLLPEGEDGDE